MQNQSEAPLDVCIRNTFEEQFEKTLVEPLLKSVDETIVTYKNLMSKEDKLDEIKLLLNEDPEFYKNFKHKYPFIEHMRVNQQIDINYFENKFRNSKNC